MIYVFTFIGEFGYELLNWQGTLRKWVKENKKEGDEIVVCSRKGLDLMYEDILSAKKNIASSISNIKPLKRRNPNSILVKIIFDSKSDEINDIFSGGSFFDVSSVVSDLNYLFPFFSNKWNSIR